MSYTPNPPPVGYVILADGIVQLGDLVWSIREGWIDAREISVGDNVKNLYGVARAESERRGE